MVVGGPVQVNTYIVSGNNDECVLIDPGAEEAQIDKAVNGRRVVAVLLTHGHFDHMMSVNAYVQAGATLYIGRGDAPALTDDRLNLCAKMLGESLRIEATPVCVKDGDIIAQAGLSFRVLETPGHTTGSICLHSGNVLFAGDTLFCDTYGRTDLPGGDAQAMFSSLHRLCTLPEETRVLSGHGDETTIGRERRNGY